MQDHRPSGRLARLQGAGATHAVRDGLVPIADILNIQSVGDAPMFGIEGDAVPGRSDQRAEGAAQICCGPSSTRSRPSSTRKSSTWCRGRRSTCTLKVKADTLDGLKGVKIRVPDKNAQDMCARRRHGAGADPVGRNGAGARVGRGRGRVDLVGVGRRREVLGVPEIRLPHQSHLVLARWSREQRHLEEDLNAAHQKAIEDLAEKLEPDFWAASLKADTDSAEAADRRRHGGGENAARHDGGLPGQDRAAKGPFLKRVPQREAVKAFVG